MRRREGSRSRDRDSEENRPAGAVRDHRADPECDRRLAGRLRRPQGSILVAEPVPVAAVTGGPATSGPCSCCGHTKLESTVRYLGIEVDDALSISEQVELFGRIEPALPDYNQAIKAVQWQQSRRFYAVVTSATHAVCMISALSYRLSN